MRALPLLLATALAGCRGYYEDPDTGAPTDAEPTDEPTGTPVDGSQGLVGTGIANPYPSALLLTDGQLDLRVDDLPVGGDTPLPVERFRWRTGFSAGQPMVLTGVDVASSGLPDTSTPAGTGSVRLLDRTTGAWLPCMAELDAHPDAVDQPSLLIRPLIALADGHDIAVAVTKDAIDRPAPFDGLMTGLTPTGLEDYQAHHDAVVADLTAAGLSADELALAWDLPIQHGTRSLATALAHDVQVTGIDLTVDDAPRVPQAWATAAGSATVTGFLDDDRHLRTDATGAALVGPDATAHVYVHVPLSVADAPAGTVPVLFFGHGIFASPEFYLDDPTDDNGVIALADELGAIVVATNWRGLTTPDLVDTTVAAGDFARLADVTDRLVQAQVNLRALMLAVEGGGLLDDPALHGVDDQVLFDPERLYYYGISLGGIEGAVLWAEGGAPVEAAALHVGGAMWSTMLERSSNWTLFEPALTRTVPDPADRQVLYAVSQLFWDPVDPISWTDPLAQRDVLLQVAIHDEQVPNFTSAALARSVDLPLLAPAVDPPQGLAPVAGPLPRAYVQLDPQRAAPPVGNRPAPETTAHTTPRDWPGQRHQVVRYLLDGTVEHFCGDAPCTPSNDGSQ